MKLSICTDVFGKIPFTEMLDKVVAYGLDAIEMGRLQFHSLCGGAHQ